jgi:hypothetical protein
MKTKIMKVVFTFALSLCALGGWAQASQTITQSVCPGTEPYLVTPGDVTNTFLWEISTGTAGVDWTITTPGSATTNVIWANPASAVTFHLSLTETNGAGCEKIVAVDVTVNPRPATPTVSITQPTCSLATGTLTVLTPIPAAGVTYTVTGTNPVVAAATNATGIFPLLASGDYDVTTTNASGCISSALSVTINAQPATPMAPTVSLIQPTCTVATGTITALTPVPAAGVTYTVTGTNPVIAGVTNATGIFSGLTSGDYDVTTTNAVGCTSPALNVTINAQPVTPIAPTAGLTQPTCAVATGTITVTSPIPAAGITYTVTGTNPAVAGVSNATGIFSGLASGDYDVTTTNAVGCTSSALSVTINAQPVTPIAPTVSLIQPTCTVATGTITVTSPIPAAGVTYTVTGTSPVVAGVTNTTGVFAGLATGTYDVTTTNGVGCTSAATVSVINVQPATPTTSAIFHN